MQPNTLIKRVYKGKIYFTNIRKIHEGFETGSGSEARSRTRNYVKKRNSNNQPLSYITSIRSCGIQPLSLQYP